MKRALSDIDGFYATLNDLFFRAPRCGISFSKNTYKLDYEQVRKAAIGFERICHDFKQPLSSYFTGSVSYRLKTMESFKRKWESNLTKERSLYKVCNDLLGIRVICSLSEAELSEIRAPENTFGITSRIVNYHRKCAKSVDDGYRAVHIYFRKRSFPVEVQLWNYKDALLQGYTHDVLYKQCPACYAYGRSLRDWIDTIPAAPDGVISFEKHYTEKLSK